MESSIEEIQCTEKKFNVQKFNLTMENMQTLNLVFFPGWLNWWAHFENVAIFIYVKNSELKRKYEFRGESALKSIVVTDNVQQVGLGEFRDETDYGKTDYFKEKYF